METLTVAGIFPEDMNLEDAVPILTDLDAAYEAGLVDDEVKIPIGQTWAFDFNNGDIALNERGNTIFVAEERDTLREWIAHNISIHSGESPLYGVNVGTIIADLIGENIYDPHVSTTIQGEVLEVLESHDRIDEVQAVVLVPVDNSLLVYVRYVSDDDVQDDLVNL